MSVLGRMGMCRIFGSRRKHVETRLIVAYGLIVLIVIAAIALVLFMHRNSHAQKSARDRKRDSALREKRSLK